MTAVESLVSLKLKFAYSKIEPNSENKNSKIDKPFREALWHVLIDAVVARQLADWGHFPFKGRGGREQFSR